MVFVVIFAAFGVIFFVGFTKMPFRDYFLFLGGFWKTNPSTHAGKTVADSGSLSKQMIFQSFS